MRSLLLALSIALLPATMARAHPHQFIDAALSFVFDDQGRLAALSVLWIYDDLTSLIILEELGMDGDGDGVLQDAELAQLRAVVGTWPEGFRGDLQLTRADAAVGLSGPLDPEATYHEGRLVTRHLRALPERLDMAAGAVEVQIFDPAYYTFYDLIQTPDVRGRDGCRVAVAAADIAAAQRLYEAELALLSEEALLDGEAYPEIGGAFADRVTLTCD